MVVFNCNACGEALKKNQVEKHYQVQCRRCEVLSCVDCGKEFWGNDYEQHVKCISEEEKYSGKNFKPKPNANKGEQKQELWTQQVQAAVSKVSANAKLKNILQQLIDFPNIPRKKVKFENFLKNSFRVYDTRLASEVWEAISAELNKQTMISEVFPTNGNVSEQPADESATSEEVLESSNGGACIDRTNQTKNEKKKKKSRQDSLANITERDKASNNNGCDETGEESGKSKKKNKKKTIADRQADVVVQNNGTHSVENNLGQHESKKKKKKKKKGDEKTSQNVKDQDIVKGESHEGKKQKRKRGNDDDDDNGKISQKKQKHDEDSVANEESIACKPVGSFKWEAAIVGVLKREADNQLKIKRLRKKVMAEFQERGGDGKTYTEENLEAKFRRKIEKCSRLKLTKDCVRLVK